MGRTSPVQKIRKKTQFPACATQRPPLLAQLPWACSSVVEHCVDIAGVASSILATPTIENPVKSTIWRGFCLPDGGVKPCRAHDFSGQILGKFHPVWANSGHENAGRAQPNSDSVAARRRGRAEPHDVSSSTGGRVVSTVVHGPHISASKWFCIATRRAISSAGKGRNAAVRLHRARDPPTHTPGPSKSLGTLSQTSMADGACAGMCHSFTKHGVSRLQQCR